MPLYYFHTTDGEETLDREGAEFDGPADARAQAIQTMGEILKDQGATHWDGLGWAMRVVGEDGALICRLRFAADAT
jgi:hypothetical protein